MIPDNEAQNVLLRELFCHCYNLCKFSCWKLKCIFPGEKAFWTRILFSTVQNVSTNCGKCSRNIIYYKIVFQGFLFIRIPFYWVPPDIIKYVSILSNYIIPYIPHLLLLQLISLSLFSSGNFLRKFDSQEYRESTSPPSFSRDVLNSVSTGS